MTASRPEGSVSIARRGERPAPKAEPGRVLLVRHVRTAMSGHAGKGDRVDAWMDEPPDAAGRRQAALLGKQFSGLPVDLVLTSDLQRARILAAAIAKATGAKCVVTRRLRPWFLGEFQGQSSEAVRPQLKEYMSEARQNEPVPGGEAFATFRDRFLGCLNDAIARAKPGVLIVLATHGRNIRMAEAWLASGARGTHLTRSILATRGTEPGEVFEIECGMGGPTGKTVFDGFGE